MEANGKNNGSRGLLRISLRTLLVLVTILCLWFGKISIEARRQREAVEWLRKNEGYVYYEYQAYPDGLNVEPQDDDARWYVRLLGEDYFHTVVCAHTLYSGEMTDVRQVANLPGLRILEITGQKISDLTPLAQLTKLEELDISDNCITDLTPLAGLSNLRVLNASNNHIEDVSPLKSLKNLTSVNLEANRIRQIEPLSSMTGLAELLLGSNDIDDCRPIYKLKNNLQRFSLGANPMSREMRDDLKAHGFYIHWGEIE